MRLEDIDRNPQRASARIKQPGGGQMLLRPLRPDDAPMLGRYFLGLSRETVRVYGPHPFDQQTANRLCADLDSAHTLRMLGIVDDEAGAKIIAYFIVHFGVYESDARRYQESGMPLSCAFTAVAAAVGKAAPGARGRSARRQSASDPLLREIRFRKGRGVPVARCRQLRHDCRIVERNPDQVPFFIWPSCCTRW